MTTEEILHALKAYRYYMRVLTACGFNEVTAQYIKEHWNEDYDFIEQNSFSF